MIARLRDERGVGLSEVMVSVALMAVVIGAALTPFEVLQTTERTNTHQNEAQDNARQTIGVIAKNLRNTSGQNQLINLATPYDLVVETVDATAKPAGSQNARNLMRLRYCLDTTSSSASLTSGIIWEQTVKWTTATPPSTMPGVSCPDPSWGTSRILAKNITNKATSARRPTAQPLFQYFPNANALDTITSIRMKIYSDRAWGQNPPETELTSGILLRNQNGSPTASFTVTPGVAGSRKLTLNAGTSTDPEGLPLTYRWCDVTTQTLCDDTTRVGTGVLYTYTAPLANTRKIQLQVFDVGGLQAIAGPLSVVAP